MATKIRSVRVNDELWEKAQEKAGNDGVSKVINELLTDWVQDAQVLATDYLRHSRLRRRSKRNLLGNRRMVSRLLGATADGVAPNQV